MDSSVFIILFEPSRFRQFDSLTGLTDDVDGCTLCVFDQPFSVLRTENTYSRRQAVGSDAVRCNYRHQAVIGQPNARARIDDVRVPFAIDLDVLKKIV